MSEELTEEEEITNMCKDILEMLVKTKKNIIDKFMEYGYDGAYFDFDLLLKVKIDDKSMQVKEKWKKTPLDY
jgi:hypothetical protein